METRLDRVRSEPHLDAGGNLISLVPKAAFPSPRPLQSPGHLLLRAQEAREGRASGSAHRMLSPPRLTPRRPPMWVSSLLSRGPEVFAQSWCPGSGMPSAAIPLSHARVGLCPLGPDRRLPRRPLPAGQAPSLPALLFSFVPSMATWEPLILPPLILIEPLAEDSQSKVMS